MTIKIANDEIPTMKEAVSFELIHACNSGWIIRDENKKPTEVFAFSSTKDLTEFLTLRFMTELVIPPDAFKPAVSDDGWIEWKGGECPVNINDTVEYALRGNSVLKATARYLSWQHDGSSGDIIKYRVVPQ